MPISLSSLKKMFERETGKLWNAEEGIPWLQLKENLDLCERTNIKARNVYLTLSDKANWLRQPYCYVCKPESVMGPISLRIKPESWQAMKLKPVAKKAFKTSIANHLATRLQLQPYKGAICLSFLFVCQSTRNIKDLDNMAKLVMDSLKGVVMGDDKDVDHLNLLRLSHEGDIEFMSFQLGVSNVNNHNDVLHKEFCHSWPNEEIRLEDFLDQAASAE